jgi:hypothetical protein
MLSRACRDAILDAVSKVIDVVADIPSESRSLDLKIAGLARRQHGVVTHQQLSALGFSRSGVQYRVQTGRLHRIHRGVYAVGRADVSEAGRLLAAVLACGHDAVLSHHSAAALWGIRACRRRLIDVTALQHHHRRRCGIAVHLVRELHPDDRAMVESIPVTSVARTLVDLAGVVRPDGLARALEETERLKLFDLRAVDALIARSQGRRGCEGVEKSPIGIPRASSPDPLGTRAAIS